MLLLNVKETAAFLELGSGCWSFKHYLFMLRLLLSSLTSLLFAWISELLSTERAFCYDMD